MESKNSKYLYTLESRKVKKGTCPNCGHSNTFVYYVLTSSGEKINDEFGKCDRVNNCGYDNRPPKGYFSKNKASGFIPYPKRKPLPVNSLKPSCNVYISDIMPEWMEYSSAMLTGKTTERECPFLSFLHDIKRAGTADNVHILGALYDYNIGIAPNGRDVLYWYVDEKGRVADCKSIAYCRNGHRDKTAKYGELSYYGLFCNTGLRQHYLKDGGLYGGALPLPDEVLTDENKPEIPMFGQHLISACPDDYIVIVESEKTALLGRMLYPELVFVATRGKHNFSTSRDWSCLYGRNVVVYADRDAEQEWKDKIPSIKAKSGANVMNLVPLRDIVDRDFDTLPDNYDIGDYFTEILTAKTK